MQPEKSFEDGWTDAMYFLPSIGPRYQEGLVDGKRVLLLGESHYANSQEDVETGRRFTRKHFDWLRDCELQPGNGFWGKLQRLVARNPNPTRQQANEAWQRVAYSNLVQEFVGNGPRQRPTREQWATVEPALHELLHKLRPDVVLVLGVGTWNHIKHGSWSNEDGIVPAIGPRRSIWLLPHAGGEAKSTWVYHPSSGREKGLTRIEVFEALLERATGAQRQDDVHGLRLRGSDERAWRWRSPDK